VPHTIRLQGPWQCESLAAGHVRYRRSFHRPTGLGPGHRTWLTIRGVDEIAQVQLNDCPLIAEEDSGQLRRFEITDRLAPRNVVSIEVSASSPPSALEPDLELGAQRPQVALEIEEPE
jgi:beta-galactosidase/beta-glucuronidase